jgi:hypothetical protein
MKKIWFSKKLNFYLYNTYMITPNKPTRTIMSFENQSRIMSQEHEQQMPPRKHIMVPPMRYDLKKQTLDQIKVFINQQITWGAYPTPEAMAIVNTFIKSIEEKYKNGFQLTYGYIPAPPHSEVTRRVIGKDGYFFKMTTTVSGIDFIWHDRVTNMFLFWGSSVFNVVKAMNSIRWRIQKCYSMPPPPPKRTPYEGIEDISDDEDEDDMPELIDVDGNIVSSGRVPDHEHGKIE